MRESLFGALESLDAIDGARVLDLYAGSGALGLEALSRGAASAELVERSRPAAAVVRKNLSRVLTAAPGVQAQVHEREVRAYLSRASGPFDLVFSDPPYDLSDEAMNADLVAVAPLLSSEAIVVVERARRATPPDFAGAGLALFRERSYGDTGLWWAEPAQPGDEVQSR